MSRVGNIKGELLHVPRAGWTALSTEPAVHTGIFVFNHHLSGLRQRFRHKMSCTFFNAGVLRRDRSSTSGPFSVMVRQLTGQISMQASHSIQRFALNTVCISQFRQRSASLAACWASNPSSTSFLETFLQRHMGYRPPLNTPALKNVLYLF